MQNLGIMIPMIPLIPSLIPDSYPDSYPLIPTGFSGNVGIIRNHDSRIPTLDSYDS